jgi:hypothetical protein
MFQRAAYSFALGFGIFLLGVALRMLLDRWNVTGVTAMIDDILTGIFAGLLVFAYERHQHKAMLDRMRIIADMNHHVRNALQPIVYSPFLKEQAEQVRMIQEGTKRIEWALKEVLTGESAEQPPGSNKQSAA